MIEVIDYVPDMIDGYDDAIAGVRYMEHPTDPSMMIPVMVYDGNAMAGIAVEQEGCSWEEALEWAGSMEFNPEFNVIVLWPFNLIEFEFEPEGEEQPKKPHLHLVH